MNDYTLSTSLELGYDDAVDAVRTGLAEQGFGVITEIDMSATLKEKVGVDLSPTLILGACRPQLAAEAIQADPSIAAVLPCNVVVRAVDDNTTVVEAFDPAAMMGLSEAASTNAPLVAVAQDARERLTAMLETLT